MTTQRIKYGLGDFVGDCIVAGVLTAQLHVGYEHGFEWKKDGATVALTFVSRLVVVMGARLFSKKE